jgi:hypothetical protein
MAMFTKEYRREPNAQASRHNMIDG